MARQERLKLALAALQDEKGKLPIRGAAKKFQVPYILLLLLLLLIKVHHTTKGTRTPYGPM